MNIWKKIILVMAFATLASASASAQHVVAVLGGAGMTTARFYPNQETRDIWGVGCAGVSWRYYTKERFLGGFGIDLEWQQRGYSYAPYAAYYEDKKDYKYYTRTYNSLNLPIVWQPHVYLFKKHFRLYIEAAATFCVNFASTFKNEETETSGVYDFRLERDNMLGFGLAAGAGFDILIKQFEVGFRFRYDIGYGDILRNRTKYYDNALDEQKKRGENPFWYTPLRSPVDNISLCLKIGYRFNKNGFDEWYVKRRPRKKGEETFKYIL